jgi:hypothetical protein
LAARDDAGTRADLYWSLVDDLAIDPAVAKSTMMGFPCLRVRGRFFASLDRRTHHLIVKLPAGRVGALVASGEGVPFNPNGRVFREWVAVPVADPDRWRALMGEAKQFAGG